jgi:general secretion pathway protein D
VHVEALIVEMTADKAAEFGVQWQALHDTTSNATQGFGGTNFGAPAPAPTSSTARSSPGSLARG